MADGASLDEPEMRFEPGLYAAAEDSTSKPAIEPQPAAEVSKGGLILVGEGPIKSFIEKVNRKFRCKLCGREGPDKSNVLRHLRRMHTPAVASRCSNCGRTYKNRESLYNHLISRSCQRPVDIDPKDPRILSLIKYDPARTKWICKICDADYRQSGYIRNHVAVVHIGLENFTTQEVVLLRSCFIKVSWSTFIDAGD